MWSGNNPNPNPNPTPTWPGLVDLVVHTVIMRSHSGDEVRIMFVFSCPQVNLHPTPPGQVWLLQPYSSVKVTWLKYCHINFCICLPTGQPQPNPTWPGQPSAGGPTWPGGQPTQPSWPSPQPTSGGGWPSPAPGPTPAPPSAPQRSLVSVTHRQTDITHTQTDT